MLDKDEKRKYYEIKKKCNLWNNVKLLKIWFKDNF